MPRIAPLYKSKKNYNQTHSKRHRLTIHPVHVYNACSKSLFKAASLNATLLTVVEVDVMHNSIIVQIVTSRCNGILLKKLQSNGFATKFRHLMIHSVYIYIYI